MVMAGWSALAFAQGQVPEVELTSAAAVREMCASVSGVESNLPEDPIERGRVRAQLRAARERVARQLNVVALPSTQFRFIEYDEDRSELEIDTRRNLRAFGGDVELFPAGFAGLRVTPADARRLVDLQRRGQLSLRIAFVLGAGTSDRPCFAVSRPGAPTVVRIEVAYLELVGAEGRVLARKDTERYEDLVEELRAARALGAGPSVVISGPTVSGDTAVAAVFAGEAARPIQRSLLDCYRQGLRLNARLQGALVVAIEIQSSGQVRSARLEVDSLGDAATSGCILAALRAVPMPRRRRGETRVSVPILLALP